jgi:undecaprenyl-diphosphatase
MLGITQLGSTVFLIGAGLVVVWQLRAAGRKHAAVLLIGATMGAETLSQTLKLVFHRARPETFFGLAAPNTFSFPSGHAMVSACFYGVLAAILSTRISSTRGKAGVWLLSVLIAGAIGLSRIYLGVHYPSDVLAGYAAAVIWVGAVRAGYHIWLRRRARGSAVSEQG